jgi:hypothetical protein
LTTQAGGSAAGPTTEDDPVIPTIYTAKIHGTNVRFFPPQTDDELMPWVDVEALMDAMSLKGIYRGAAKVVEKAYPHHSKRIGTSKGFANITSFSNAKGMIWASVEQGYITKEFKDEYATQLFAAASLIHPELFDQVYETGEWIINSRGLARLMGEDHEKLVDYIDVNRVAGRNPNEGNEP